MSSPVPTNFTDYEFQAVINLSDLEILELFFNNLSFPVVISNISGIHSMDTTTGIAYILDLHRLEEVSTPYFSFYLLILFPQCVHEIQLGTSARVRRTLSGLTTTVLHMEPVTSFSVTHVAALMISQLVVSSVS